MANNRQHSVDQDERDARIQSAEQRFKDEDIPAKLMRDLFDSSTDTNIVRRIHEAMDRYKNIPPRIPCLDPDVQTRHTL